MLHHEKKAFLKFFITYFVSVASLILTAGYFYFVQIKAHIMRMEEFSLIEYARHVKMGDASTILKKDYSYEIVDKNTHIDIKNLNVTDDKFSKLIPLKLNRGYIKVSKTTKEFNEKLNTLRQRVILIQALLLFIFAYISYKLAKNALKPMQESINTLDKFAKDLIHDLNTPVTSIKLNLQILESDECLKNNKALKRLDKSVHSISELHDNLTILLQEETFQMEMLNLCKVVDEVITIQRQIYPEISFYNECREFNVKLNHNAIKQILQNIISNASKYNTQNGYVKVYHKDKTLYIEDSGKGIKEPQKIFDRFYSDENSSGLGLDIVKRLAHTMDIKLNIISKEQGIIFTLTMA